MSNLSAAQAAQQNSRTTDGRYSEKVGADPGQLDLDDPRAAELEDLRRRMERFISVVSPEAVVREAYGAEYKVMPVDVGDHFHLSSWMATLDDHVPSGRLIQHRTMFGPYGRFAAVRTEESWSTDPTLAHQRQSATDSDLAWEMALGARIEAARTLGTYQGREPRGDSYAELGMQRTGI